MNFFGNISVAVVCIIGLLTLNKAAQAEAEDLKHAAAISWLSENAIPLRTVEAGNGFADMEPLKKLIGNARLVALGEATHGTREFFQLKHRMLEFLVSEMGFTIFAIEATMPEAFDINEYVLTGRGDPEKALAGLYFWTWNTQEVLEMIRWMRRYNSDPRHKRKVKFYGFDMQSSTRAAKTASAYLRKVDSVKLPAIDQALALLADPFIAEDFRTLSQEKKEAASASIAVLLKRFDERKEDYIRMTSTSEWALARQHVQIVAQSIEKHKSRERGFRTRDKSMADNALWILDHEGPGAKMVIWAHNGHVMNRPGWMGAHLRKVLEDEMVVFGFAFNQGWFQARSMPLSGPLKSFRVGPASESSLDGTLAAAGLSLAVVDLHSLPKTGPVAEWFADPHGTRSVGSAFDEKWDNQALRPRYVVTDVYDALLFVETTTSARANPSGVVRAKQRLAMPSNLGFEDGEPGEPPARWIIPERLAGFAFQTQTTTANPYSGTRCAMIERKPGKHYGEVYGGISQRIDATAYKGKRIRLAAAVRTELRGSENKTYLWLRVERSKKDFADIFQQDSRTHQSIESDTWREIEVTADVPADADTISYGMALVGEGKVWMDSVSIITDGPAVEPR